MLPEGVIKSFISKEFMRFLLVGGCAAAINFFSRFFFRIFFSCVESVTLSFLLGTIVSFIFNRTYTFKAYDERVAIQCVKFVIIAILSIIIASFIVYSGMAMHDFLNITLIGRSEMESVVHLAAIGIITIYNFLAMKYVSFRKVSRYPRAT